MVVIDPNPAFSVFYLLLTKILGAKILGFTTHIPDKSSLWGKISDFILKFNDFLIDSYVVPSSVKKQLMIKLGIDSNKINVIGHAIDVEKFQIAENAIKNKISTQKKIILFVGRFVCYKGIKYLVESFQLVNEKINGVCLVLIGDGPEKPSINQLIKNLKLSDDVLQIDNIANSEIPEYYAEADILVVPSIEPEPFGLVYIEGMSAGKPIITFNVGGGEQDLIYNQKNGLLVNSKDVNGLANAIIDLLEDDKKRKQMGMNARKFVEENYDIHIIAEKWRKIIRDLVQ
ncbi:MAG: glycosyltransferase family 4 protein [Nitrosotalea sp.]